MRTLTREEFNQKFSWVFKLDRADKMAMLASLITILLVPEVMLESFLSHLKDVVQEENEKRKVQNA